MTPVTWRHETPGVHFANATQAVWYFASWLLYSYFCLPLPPSLCTTYFIYYVLCGASLVIRLYQVYIFDFLEVGECAVCKKITTVLYYSLQIMDLEVVAEFSDDAYATLHVSFAWLSRIACLTGPVATVGSRRHGCTHACTPIVLSLSTRVQPLSVGQYLAGRRLGTRCLLTHSFSLTSSLVLCLFP